MDGIRSFRELSAEQEACAGGKGRVLARLAQAGYPVPDGLVILPMAFSGDDCHEPQKHRSDPAGWSRRT